MPDNKPILVTDFDGTMTQRDFYRVAMARLVPPETPDFWEDYLAGRLTHFETMQAIFSRIRGPECSVMAVAREMELDPRAGEAVKGLQAAGWSIVIASAGCQWYIDRLLAEQNIHVTIYANPGVYDPLRGLLLSPPVDSPYFSPQTGIDKLAIMRVALETSNDVAFAGDGPPDLQPALLAAPHRRFARGYLADMLQSRNEPFRSFEHWSEIAAMLLS